MRLRILAFVAAVLCAVQPMAFGAEIAVPPGAGTLAAAIASASDGDTLVLRDGAYGGAATVDKSLTIRAADRLTEALVSDELTISGAGIEVTIQGLTFTQDVVAISASRVNILQNHWLARGINTINYKTSEGDGALLVVGNKLDGGSIYGVYTDGAYIGGNVLKNGYVHAYSSVWIVANEIHRDEQQAITVEGSGAIARVLGNRVSCKDYFPMQCVRANIGGLAHIANNVIEITDLLFQYVYEHSAIYTSGAGYTRAINNIIRGVPPDAGYGGCAIMTYTAGAQIMGNIILDYLSTQSPGTICCAGACEITHNLCFNNSSDCPAGEGNLNVDPQFVDLADYKLSATSPAIDAGSPDYTLADLDRTRNDIGAYGGPWSIGQYDVQRSPTVLAPYVYPLSTKDEVYGGGVLEVQALGVARLR
jgi:hypothetical protein